MKKFQGKMSELVSSKNIAGEQQELQGQRNEIIGNKNTKFSSYFFVKNNIDGNALNQKIVRASAQRSVSGDILSFHLSSNLLVFP